MAEWAPVLGCLLLGTWSALDGAAVGQALVSRPLVTGTLTGWMLGEPGSGMLLGLLLEGVYLGGVPAGGARLPEPGPAAVGGAWAYANLSGPGGLALGLGLAVALAALGGLSVTAQRMANGSMTRRASVGIPSPPRLARAHWACLGLDTARGFVLTATGLALAAALPVGLSDGWPLGMAQSVALFALPSAVTIGAVLREWSRTPGRSTLLVAACVAGLLMASVL